MARPIERQKVILALLAEVWKQPYNQDLRLGQLMENCGIGWDTEDLNDVINNLCDFGNIPTYQWLLWGTRGKNGKKPLKYKRMIDLETSHLEALLKEDYCNYKEEIKKILNQRNNGT